MAPPARGTRRLPWERAEFAALDFETTGLDPARDAVISFGSVPVRRGRIVLGEAVYELVSPPIEPSPASVIVHGLRAADLRGARPLGAVRQTLRAALSGRVLLTWHGEIESAFLSRILGGRPGEWRRRSIDVRGLAIAADRGAGELTLTGAATRHGVPVADPHHALDDALVTAQLLLVLAGRRRGPPPTVGALMREARRHVRRESARPT